MSEAQTGRRKPGWYDDPNYAGTKRYWDGQRWTEHREPPLPTAQPKQSAGKTLITLVQLALWGILIAGVVLFLAYALQGHA